MKDGALGPTERKAALIAGIWGMLFVLIRDVIAAWGPALSGFQRAAQHRGMGSTGVHVLSSLVRQAGPLAAKGGMTRR